MVCLHQPSSLDPMTVSSLVHVTMSLLEDSPMDEMRSIVCFSRCYINMLWKTSNVKEKGFNLVPSSI